jgi:Ca2+-binding RTX toxin-like protein
VGGAGAGLGGAVFNQGTLNVINSTFTANSALGGAGATISNGMSSGGGLGAGGAIFNLNGSVTLTNDTLDANIAAGGAAGGADSQAGQSRGGAVYNLAYGNRIQDGSASIATLTLANTILGGSTDGNRNAISDLVNDNINGNNTNTATITIAAPSIVQSAPTTLDGTTITGTPIIADPMLWPLVNSGGPTETMALQYGSPAIDAGSNAFAVDANGNPLTTDQRGFPRIVNGTVDIGAFEQDYPPWLASPTTPTPIATVSGPTSGVRTQPVAFTFGELQVLNFFGSIVPAGGGIYTIEWGDGSPEQTVRAASNADSVTVDHQFIISGPSSIYVFVTNPLGGVSSAAIENINITPAPDGTTGPPNLIINRDPLPDGPLAALSGPTVGVRYQPEAFTFSATDPLHASTQTADGFTYTINWGDGSATQTVQPSANNGNGVTLDHQFTTAGKFTVRVTATDSAGIVSPFGTQSITIAATGLLADPLHPGQNALYIGGTSGNDTIRVRQTNNGYAVGINNSASPFGATFTGPVSRIVVYTGAGNDTVRFNPNVRVGGWIYGGAGNDNLEGAANAANVIVGGSGNNVLIGGNRRDILIGGSGSDKLFGGTAQDVLIAGATSFDQNEVALNALQVEWNAHRSYAVRVANLRGTGTGPRNNGTAFLVASGPSETVFASDKGSTLTSGTGQDWLFPDVSGSGSTDTISQRTPSQTVDRLA